MEKLSSKPKEFLKQKNYIQAIKFYNILLEKGNGRGAYMLGILYQKGKGVNINYPMAFNCFLKADELEFSKAPNALGLCYKNGLGVDYDPEKSIRYFEKGVKLNHTISIVNLGKIYYTGEIVQKDFNKAEKLFKKAIEFGHPTARYMLCELYREIGNKESVYKICKEKVDKITANKLGILYRRENKLKKAKKWFIKAVELGNNINGNRNLGLVYKLEKDYDKMQEHYLLGNGYFKLAQAYEEIDNDMDRYFETLDLGKENGCPQCINELKLLQSI